MLFVFFKELNVTHCTNPIFSRVSKLLVGVLVEIPVEKIAVFDQSRIFSHIKHEPKNFKPVFLRLNVSFQLQKTVLRSL
jgi:hypothetical protein